MKRGLYSTTALTFSGPVYDPVSGAIAAGLVGAGVSATAAAAIGAFTVRLASALVLSFAAQALAPKPKLPKLGGGGLLANAREPAAPQEYVYGQVRKGGVVTYLESTGSDNRLLHMIIALAGHEVEEIGDIYVNDEIVSINEAGLVQGKWKSRLTIQKNTGSENQTADPTLLSRSDQVDDNFRGRGIAYLYARLGYDPDTFAGGIPLITAVVKGRKVYDPRTDTVAYSANAALCLRDYLTAEFGLNDPAVNDTVFSVAANVCDEVVNKADGGTEKRYEMNGIVRADSQVGTVLQEMTTCCAGSLFWGQAGWQLKPGYYSAPVATFTLDDLRGPINLATRVNVRENFNAVQGVFNDASQDYVQAEYPALSSSAFTAEDGGDESVLDFQLPLTTSASAAQRLAKLALFRGREQISFSADFGLAAFGVQVGDNVALTMDRYGWDAKPFEVVGWRFFINGEGGDLRVNLTLRETSAAAFDWNAEEIEIIANNTSLIGVENVPPIGISATSEAFILNEQLTNRFRVTVSSGQSERVDRVEVQYKKSSEAAFVSAGIGAIGVYDLVDVEDGNYDFRARAINAFGVRGEWESLTGIAAGNGNLPPPDVEGFSIDINGATAHLSWDQSARADLSFYRIRHAVEATGATWANATTAIDKVPRPATTISLPARSGTYMIRAYSKSGLASTEYASVSVSADQIAPLANVLSQVEHSSFSGTKTRCSVVSNSLRITDTSAAPSDAVYDFSDVIDAGSARIVTARIDAAMQRIDSSAGLWDDMPGLWDDAPGLWDDLGGSAQFADCDVEMWVSSTEDDPDGTPTWSDYRKIRVADIYGRAFRFRIVLRSANIAVTPAVSSLTAFVEYA